MSSPFVVAQLLIPSDGLATSGTTYLVPDWQRGLIHFVNEQLIRTYQTVKATQTPLRSVVLTGITIYAIPGLDAVTGDILILGSFPDHPGGNNMPMFRLNPATGLVGNWDGVGSSLGSYPSGYWVPEQVVGVASEGVSYGIVKENAFSDAVAVCHISSPANHAGHENGIVTNNRNNRATMCAGATGGSSASAYLLDSNSPGQTTVNVYYVRIAAGAGAYNPASWPTTNPAITSGVLATVNMADIDPTWTQIAGSGIAYDQTDGNVIILANHVSTTQHVAKINVTTGAVMWVAQPNINQQDMFNFRLANGRLWIPGGINNGSNIIDTATGEMTTTPLTGVSFLNHAIAADADNLIVFRGSYTAGGADAPEAASGTSSFSSGWGLLWPIPAPAPPSGLAIDDVQVRTIPVPPCQIFLDWSDDRAHSFGSPVGQPMGALGEYRTFVQWQRLGYARDRVWRLSWSCPRPTALQGAWIELTAAKT